MSKEYCLLCPYTATAQKISKEGAILIYFIGDSRRGGKGRSFSWIAKKVRLSYLLHTLQLRHTLKTKVSHPPLLTMSPRRLRRRIDVTSTDFFLYSVDWKELTAWIEKAGTVVLTSGRGIHFTVLCGSWRTTGRKKVNLDYCIKISRIVRLVFFVLVNIVPHKRSMKIIQWIGIYQNYSRSILWLCSNTSMTPSLL